MNRHEQLWEIHQAVGASNIGLDTLLRHLNPQMICWCRAQQCGNDEAALHVKAYTGVDADTVISLSGDVRTPLRLLVGPTEVCPSLLYLYLRKPRDPLPTNRIGVVDF